MSEVSTRIWLDERLWDEVRRRAIAEGTTIRELIPRLVSRTVASELPAFAGPRGSVVSAQAGTPQSISEASSTARPPSESGPPVVVLSDVYQCAVCGAQVRLGGLSNHLGKHVKERQASEAERS